MLTVRHIKTKTVPVRGADGQPVVQDGKPVTQIVPELDAEGREIELWSVEVPHEIEHAGGDAIDAHVAATRTTSAPAPAAAKSAKAAPTSTAADPAPEALGQ